MSTERFCIVDYNDRRDLGLTISSFILELKYNNLGFVNIDDKIYQMFHHKHLDFFIIGNFESTERFEIAFEKKYVY
jgi:hypothetical protein